MKLCISNIAWSTEHDDTMYQFLKNNGFDGLEIAPTRIFSEKPYDHLSEARDWAQLLKDQYGLAVPSMQSIWYGHTEKIFGSKEERKILLDYTKKAINFAEIIGCNNLVFGNPKNRNAEDIPSILPIAIDFFKEIGDYALDHNTVVALEPNPTIYNTRFMNYTEQAVEMAYKSSSDGIKVNIDLGTIIHNEEDIDYLKQIPEYINHVHISEPGLNLIEKRDIHRELFAILSSIGYNSFISIEMANKGNIEMVKSIIEYVKALDRND